MANFCITSFDPASTRNLGWATAILDQVPSKETSVTGWSCGTFVMPTTDERWQVLWPIFAVTEAFLEDPKPDLVIIEKTSSFAGGYITGQVSQCMGAIYAVCGKLNCNLDFVYPSSIKKVVAGNGRAKKSQLKKSVSSLLEAIGIEKMKFDSEHAADASANILYWLIKHEVIAPLEF